MQSIENTIAKRSIILVLLLVVSLAYSGTDEFISCAINVILWFWFGYTLGAVFRYFIMRSL